MRTRQKASNPNWDSPNEAPVAEDFKVEGIEGEGNLVINLLGHASDPDGDALVVTSVTLADGTALPDYMTNNGDGTVTVNLDAAALNDIHLAKILTVNLKYTVSDGDLSDEGAVEVVITGTADLYHGVDVIQSETKDAINSGNGKDTAETFHFDLSLPAIEDAFNFSGTVTLTVTGDIDASNENTVLADASNGDLIDALPLTSDTLVFGGTGNPGNGGVDKGGSAVDGYPADNVVASGSTGVEVAGFADGHITFDATVSEQVASGSVISATLSYDYWA